MKENNVDVWGVFGLEAPAEDTTGGGNEQEIAAPADTGEKDPEIAAPEHEDGDEGAAEDEVQEEPKDKAPLTKEQRAANAKARRQKELDEALEKERAAAKAREDALIQRFNDFLAKAKIKNAHKGNAEIKTLEDAEQWAEADKLARMNRNLKNGSLSAEDLQTALESSPAFRELKKQQEAVQAQEQQKKTQDFERSVQLELAEIKKINPEIQSLADVIKMPSGKEFAKYVQQYGMGYLDAYKLANHDQIVEQAKGVAATGAKLAAGGKEHMQRTITRDKMPVDVPAEVKANYRIFNPKMTDEEIEKEYRKFLGKT